MIAEQDYESAELTCLAELAEPTMSAEFEAQLLSLLSINEYYRGDFPAALLAAERAAVVAESVGTDAALLFALPARALASAGLPPLPSATMPPSVAAFERAWSLRAGLADLSVEYRAIAGSMLQEAAFVTGRLDEATELFDVLEEVWETSLGTPGAVNPMIYFMQLFPVRLGIFTGRIAEAHGLAERAHGRATANAHPSGILAATATLCMVSGYRGDRLAVRELADSIKRLAPSPSNHFEASMYILAAYGLHAIDDNQAAAAMVLHGSGGDALPLLQTVDRAFGYEILIVAAIDIGDTDAAQRWGELIVPLGAHPASEATVARALGRLELALGNPVTGAEHAEISVARARIGGSFLQETMGLLLHARSLAEAGVRDRAIAGLDDIAEESDRLGDVASRRQAARELRRLGRRHPPAPGSGWSGLSERERQIALLAAEGHTNRVIGASLFLSERTVQAHLSRALAALGITSRSALPRELGPIVSAAVTPAAPADLTPRQWQVVELVVEGVPNAEMAERLGISVKTIEKHVGAVFLRWGVSSRTGIAKIAVETRWSQSA